MANINTTFCSFLVIFSLVFVSSLSVVTFAYVSTEKPEINTEIPLFKIGVQGVIYCQSGDKLIPIKGAVVRVTCLDLNEDGYETTPYSILSSPTNEKGYFFTTLSLLPIKLKKLSQCKVFLNKSPLETCNVPTNVNKGISGALITNPRHLDASNLNLYSVGPFVYTSEPKPDSETNGY